MTTPPAHPAGTDSPLTPPPGCPAHGLGPEALRRLYGAEAESDPAGLYARLRAEHGPVAPVLVHGDLPAWLVLGHSENLEVMRNPSRFSRDSRRWRELREGRVSMDSPLLPVVAWQPMCSFVDGAEHERLRGAVTDSMNRLDRRGIRRYVVRFANQLVDSFAADGSAEMVRQFAERLPMMTMTQVLGMPEEYSTRLVDAARDMVEATETAISSNDFIVAVLQELVRRKRADPVNDFASWLVSHDAGLTDDEAVEHLRLVLIASYETTVNLISNTLLMVLTDRRFRASLAGGHMTLPDAVEQVLWDAPPFARVYGRWATGDTEFGDQKIKEGDLLILGLAAANMDPAVRPDLTVPVHGNRSHLAFSGGPHECPGQDIGRAIADTGIDALLMRLPDLRLAVLEDELLYESSLLSRRLIELPVQFTPQRPEATAEHSVPGPLPETVPSGPAAQPPLPHAVPAAGPGPVPSSGSYLRAPQEEPTSLWRSLTGWLRGR